MAEGDVVQSGSLASDLTLSDTPTPGNTLVLWTGLRGGTFVPSGFTAITDYIDGTVDDPVQNYRARAWYRIVETGDTAVISATGTSSGSRRVQYVEIEGTLAPLVPDTEIIGDAGCSSPWLATCGSLTAPASSIVLIGGIVAGLPVANSFSGTVVAPASELADAQGDSKPPMWLGYRKITGASGSYDMQVTVASGGCLRGWLGFLVAFELGADPPSEPPAGQDPAPGFWFPELASGGGSSDDAPLARMLPEGDDDAGGDDALANFTADVMWAKITQPGDRDHTGGSFPSTCSIRVQNADGKYNPDNTGSVLYGLLRPGRAVWVGCLTNGAFEGAGSVVGLFGGYLREIVPVAAAGVHTGTPYAELICTDALEEYKERKARVEFSTERTIQTLRSDALEAIGEDPDRLDLGNEAQTLAWSGEVATRARPVIRGVTGSGSLTPTVPFSRLKPVRPNALDLLEELNHATGTRHYIRPGGTKEEWYVYTTRLRQYNVDQEAADAWDGDDIVDASSYRHTLEGIVNTQEASVSDAKVDATPATVWEGSTPIAMDASSTQDIWADYGDYVLDAELTMVADAGISSSFTDYGQGALITLSSSGAGSVNTLRVQGRRLNRGAPVTVEKRDSSSLTTYRERAGSPISSDYLQARAEAEGVCRFVVWKFAQPLKKPSVQFINDFSTTLTRGLYDVVTMTIDALHVSARRFEITQREVEIKRSHSGGLREFRFGFELQETPNQSVLALFTAGVSEAGGTDVLGV